MKIRVLKFGGTSVGTPERVKNVVDILIKGQEKQPLAVIVSAFSGVTDQLIEMCTVASRGDEKYLTILDKFIEKHNQFADALLGNERQTIAKLFDAKIANLRDLLHGIFLLKELSLKSLDFVMCFGEWFSCQIITAKLREAAVSAEFVDARKLVRTDARFGSARVDFATTSELTNYYFTASEKRVQVITGFCGATENGETTTLGRSGSDYSAAIFGAALNAPEIEIWTDVDGVMTADPRKVPEAFTQPVLSYEEALEMSHFGAKVIHPPTMLPAMRKNIPIRILNTFNPDFPGTLIRRNLAENGGEKPESHITHAIKGVTSISRVGLLRIEGTGMIGVAGTSMRIFSALAAAGINVILITQASSEHSICLAVAPGDAKSARELLHEEFELEIQANRINPPVLEENLSIVAIVGENMRHTPGISGRFFNALGSRKINVVAIAQGSSELNISVVISAADETRAVRAIHEAFFGRISHRLNVLVAGIGLVGGTLLQQIAENQERLRTENDSEIRVVGIANSRKALLNPKGISLENWPADFANSANTSSIENTVNNLISLNLPNCVFVDCSASEPVVAQYTTLLNHEISVVTPNKKAAAGTFDDFANLKKICARSGAKFLYETNVGAGLPVISTLKDLRNSGDRIIKIEGVLSGTLSYIFNRFDGSTPFSAVVREAQQLGYTEPDPRDDLNGLDVARKLLILARETGLRIELSDIALENLVSDSAGKSETVDEFFEKLAADDAQFAEKQSAAQRVKKRLRYIATLENGNATVQLIAVDDSHPFFNLTGSDNMISFTTERYRENPLVVRGPGAGAAVTAAGVFADIIRIIQ